MATEVKKLAEIRDILLPIIELIEKSELKERYTGFREMLDQAE
jgi:hypothetical protein